MAAGDVLLFSRKIDRHNFRRDKFGTFMCALIHLTTRSRYNHAALDIGDGLMVEATNKGVAVNPIASSDEIMRIGHIAFSALHEANPAFDAYARWACRAGDSMDLVYTGNDLEEVLAWGAGRVGNRYGYVTAFFCGLRNLFPGWAIVQDRAFICSQLVADAIQRAGHDFGKNVATVSPGDLAEHFGVSRK